MTKAELKRLDALEQAVVLLFGLVDKLAEPDEEATEGRLERAHQTLVARIKAGREVTT